MSRFSIVVPVYKTEQYLDQCVNSVTTQSYPDFELILVDDGSPDGSGALCDAWAEKDSRIHVIHQENGGLSAARNSGIQHACGNYVMFLDSDDWWADSHVLMRVSHQLDQTGADVLSFNYRKEYSGRMEPPYFSISIPDSNNSSSISEMMRLGCWVTGACNKAVRRTLLTDHALYFRTGITSEDIDWTLRLALCGERFAFANTCVFIYRQHASSISNSTSPEKVTCLSKNVQECVRLLEETAPEKAELMKPFVAYQYGTLMHNVANLDRPHRSTLISDLKKMTWLLDYSDNRKIQLLRICNRCFGISGTLTMLRLRQNFLSRCGRGV